jgi:hypothetical protein
MKTGIMIISLIFLLCSCEIHKNYLNKDFIEWKRYDDIYIAKDKSGNIWILKGDCNNRIAEKIKLQDCNCPQVIKKDGETKVIYKDADQSEQIRRLEDRIRQLESQGY